MSTSHSQESRSDQSAKQRKRKERAASHAPEPKNIVSGAGQPLDLSVRRELEEQLGHDFGRVRLHTDPDAGALTEMLGADAVAVGQDIFFREGTYRPGTVDGQRLLAHELLHTVQNPHGLGTLRAGRDLGAVSLPQQAMEREAETAAQASVRPDGRTGTGPGESAAEVGAGQATPGWLRYATVDADRSRLEQIDPATLVERLANSVVRSLRGDPEDRSKRTRRQLALLPDELQDNVLERLETRLLSSEHERVLDLVDEVEAYDDLERDALDAPTAESDPAQALWYERETARREDEEDRAEAEEPAAAPGPEKEQEQDEGAPGSTPENTGRPQEGDGEQASEAGPGIAAPGNTGVGTAPEAPAGGQAEAAAPASAPRQEASSSSSSASSGGGKQSSEKAGGGREGQAGQEGQEGREQQSAPAASKEESAAKNRPGATESLVAGRQLKPEDKRGSDKPTGPASVTGKDTQLPGAFSTLDGVRNQDVDGPEEKADEDPFGSGGGSEVEVGGGQDSAWDVKLQPEDFLPAQDLDVSAVPTADKLDPSSSGAASAPSFPAPPVTKAEQVRAEREAEDAEDAAAEAVPEENGAGSSDGTEPSAEADEAGPAGGQLGGLALEQAAEARPVTTSKDPKSGDDPKAGPVAAQTTVQEAPGTSEAGSDAKEAAAKEEKGTQAGGGTQAGAQEKASPQAVAGNAAAPEPAAKEEQKKTDAAPAGRSEPAADAQSPSPARDTHVSGGSNVDTSGGAPSASQDSGPSQPGPVSRTESPAPRTPAAPEPTKPADAPTSAKAAAAPKNTASKSAPAAKGSPGGGGGGGGGGGAKASAPGKGKGKKDSGAAPNLSGVAPEAGLTTASKLKPHKALQAMSGVSGSVDRTVGDEHKSLAAAPPSMQRPAGAPQTLQGKPKSDAPAQYSQDPAAKSEAPKDEKAEVEGEKEPEGQIEAEKAEEPGGWDTFKMALGFIGGKIVNGIASAFGADKPVVDPQELAAKFAGLPTKDEALKKAQAGNAPGVEMEGAAEQTAGEQGTAVDTKGQETVATGKDDAGRPMGENQVYPNAPKEQMTAKVPGGQGGKGAAPDGGAGTGAVPPEAASEVAEHEKGPEFQAAFSDGQKGMSEGRQTKDKDFRDSQQKHKAKVDAEVATNTKSQAGEREKALADVDAERADWRTEQDAELKTLGTKKTERHEKVRTDVKDKEKKTDEDVAKEKEDGDKKIQDENTKAEKDAEKERDDSVEQSGNWVSKAFDWIKKKVIEIKDAIVRVIKAARDAVVGFIKNFKETVERWINEARKFIVEAIKNLINDLIEFAKAMVRAIIELANSIRKFITGLIEAAIALVNKLATMLKQIVTDLLDAIGKLLSSILDFLKKMLDAVVKAVVDAVKAVLDFASKLLSALGDWMLIAVDFLSDPGGWLGGAKNSAVDGAKNHLFREVKAAVKQWFNDKIQEIIGVPKAILDKLLKGGITMEEIVKEAWDAVVPQLPLIIGELVMTKIVAKLIPGAGWVMAVIDAIRTAWGALSAILSALGMVLDWLKAVRSGGAGILFAKAVAAGVVALLEVLYQALMTGIGKYVSKVGTRLKGVAAKLGKGGDKGNDKGPGAAGADDKGNNGDKGKVDDKKGQDAKPTAPKSTAPKPRPTTPKPTTPGPNSKPKTGPGDGKKPTTTSTPTSTSKDKNGQPKNKDDDKPNTRPTPSPKPKPKADPPPKPKTEPTTQSEPKAEPPAKPKTEPDTKPKPKDDTPGKPKDNDKDSTKPKDDKDTPAKPKDDKGAPTKPKDKPGDKDAPGKDGTKDPKKPKDEKERDGKTKDSIRDKKREQRTKQENSNEAKQDRLNDAISRIRAIERPKLKNGVPRASHIPALAAMRQWYRLSALTRDHPPNFQITARINPTGRVIGGTEAPEEGFDNAGFDKGDKTIPVDWLDENHRDKKLPPVKSPKFRDNALASNFTSQYLNAKFGATGVSAKKRSIEPIGFRYLTGNTTDNERWARTHLLPRELGGTIENQNLVPARQYQNMKLRETEAPAAAEISTGNKIVWYQVDISYHAEGPDTEYPNNGNVLPPGFPNQLSTAWGRYTQKPGSTGESEDHWDRQETRLNPVSIPNMEKPPKPGYVPKINVNTETDEYRLRLVLQTTKAQTNAILILRQQKNFTGDVDLLSRLQAHSRRFRLKKLKIRLGQLKIERRLKYRP
ncbi:eCIS core domain-containing protein [Streptomyces sp. TE33382]